MNYEQLGLFYLGKTYDVASKQIEPNYQLYRSSDLNTHAICVGMTGSGKTGLGIALLEEAAIDGVPAIIIDPKGDMANLCLSFPQLTGAELTPWVQSAEAEAAQQSPAAFAAAEAERWSAGLGQWEQSPERAKLLHEQVALTVYTPGSKVGEALSISDLFTLPDAKTLADPEALADLLNGTAASVLSLLGMEVEALNSREHILLANILHQSWLQGNSPDLAQLIALIQRPPFQTVGILNVADFYPEKDRFDLALRFNNLLASPGFSTWLEGQPLDIDKLLYTPAGKPRLAILSLAHLSESQRMFFVSLLLNRLLAWTRRQAGTSSLRAILYMDEIFGYFPPVQNPPSKKPLLTLLKQGRAYGLAVVLATQNPVDLDYKGLANMGSWFVGRLQTEGDKARLLDGLSGVAQASGVGFQRAELDKILSSLPKRCFVLNNVHQAEPTVFMTRWTLSYLRGPLTREELKLLKDLGLSEAPGSYASPRQSYEERSALASFTVPATASAATFAESAQTAVLQTPPGLEVYYYSQRSSGQYFPMLLALTEIYYKNKDGQEFKEEDCRLCEVNDGPLPVNWAESVLVELSLDELSKTAKAGLNYAPLPAAARKKEQYKVWERDVSDYLYREKRYTLFGNKNLKAYSQEGESEQAFVLRLRQEYREYRDQEIEQIKQKYEKRLQSLGEKLRRAKQAVAREEEQERDAKRQSVISIGRTILTAFMGSKKLGSATLGGAATAARGMSRAGRAAGDTARAEDTVKTFEQDWQDLEQSMEQEMQNLAEKLDARITSIERLELKPLKQDVRVRFIGLCWVEA